MTTEMAGCIVAYLWIGRQKGGVQHPLVSQHSLLADWLHACDRPISDENGAFPKVPNCEREIISHVVLALYLKPFG